MKTRSTEGRLRITVVGCGCIGAYVGGKLALSSDADVTFLLSGSTSSKSLAAAVDARGGITLEGPGESKQLVTGIIGADGTGSSTLFTFDAAVGLTGAELVLVATKRNANIKVRTYLEKYCPGAPVVMFQNGLDAAKDLGHLRAFQCIIAVNVVSNPAEGVFTRTTPMPKLTLDAGTEVAFPGITRRLSAAGFAVKTLSSGPFLAAQRGKLLVNMVNAPNALSGKPTLYTLFDRTGLALIGATARECILCFDAAGYDVKPSVLRFAPTVISIFNYPLVHGFVCAVLTVLVLTLAAARAIACRLGVGGSQCTKGAGSSRQGKLPWWSHLNLFDATAHSSMWEDLQRNRPSEVDYLNGAVVALGRKVGVSTPTNDAVLCAVHEVEASGSPPCFSSANLRELIRD